MYMPIQIGGIIPFQLQKEDYMLLASGADTAEITLGRFTKESDIAKMLKIEDKSIPVRILTYKLTKCEK